MAGGIFEYMNKVRPGAYINFKAAVPTPVEPGIRGRVLLPIVSDWVQPGVPYTVNAATMMQEPLKVTAACGITPGTYWWSVIAEALTKCTEVILVPLVGTGAVAATKQVTGQGDSSKSVTVTAKRPGVFGNRLAIRVVSVKNPVGSEKELDVLLDGNIVDKQIISTWDETIDNPWVTFETSEDDVALVEVTAVPLTGGKNQETVTLDNYMETLEKCSTLVFNTLAAALPDLVVDTSSVFPNKIQAWVKDLREKAGRYVQAVVYVPYTAKDPLNDEFMIQVCQAFHSDKTPTTTHDYKRTVVYTAALTAGAANNESNTYSVVQDVDNVYPPIPTDDVVGLLGKGFLLYTHRSDGQVVVEKDINSLHEFDVERPYAWSKNRTMRVLDDIATWVSNRFEKYYIGKVSNVDSGRTLFQGDVIGYLNGLQDTNAIINFDSQRDIEVLPGNDKESIVVHAAIETVDSMEKLYLTVTVK